MSELFLNVTFVNFGRTGESRARDEVPQALLRDRLALRVTEACVAIAGRPEQAGALRDEVHLLRPGEQPGPAGAVYVQWRRAVARPISAGALQAVLPQATAGQIAVWLDAGPGAGWCPGRANR